MSTRAATAVIAAGSGLVTIVAATASVTEVAYRSPSLRVAVETAAALISLLAAQLVLGRYARSTQQADLLLGAGLLVLALGTLAFSALPAVLGAEDDPVATWGALIVRTAGVALFALGAWARPRAIRHPARVGRLTAAGACAVLVVILAALAAAGDTLPGLARPDLAADGAVWPPLDAATVLQVATMLLFAAGAVGFMRRADRTGDAMARWLAIAATLGAFSRLNYLIHPSLGTSWFFAGDLLRLGFFVALLVAGIEELRRNQRELADAAVMDERQRIAREIHDGMAQDLAFIVQQGRHLQRRLEPARGLELIVMAAQRALDESREAVAALVRPPCQPLADALAQTAREAAEREGSTVDTDLVPDVAVPGATQEAMLRILREAVINAARHGGARCITVELRDDPNLCLSVRDDGRGFDVARASGAPGRQGLKGMAERVRGIGGELSIESEPGRGTEVRVTVP